MKTRRNRISRRQARQMLDAPTGADEVSALLRDTAVDPARAELPGETEALAAFRAAAPVSASVPTTESDSFMSKLVRKAVAAPLATAGALGLALAGGGIAVAASNGAHIPLVTGNHAHPAHPAHPTHPAHPAHPSQAATPTRTATPTAAGTPSPSLVGLCHAWLAHKGTDGKWASSPAFTALVDAAGGRDNVSAYCGLVVTHPAHPSHPARPTQAANPTKSAHPLHPVHPTHPAKPSKSAHPTHPAKPTQAANPTKPAHPLHPTHPAKPTQAAQPGVSKKAAH